MLNILNNILVLLTFMEVYSITPEKLITSDSKKVYYIENQYKYDWFESLTKCARMNMTLLAIDSKTKSEDINNLVLKAFGKNFILWFGGYAVGTNRQFTWVTTCEEFTYTFWHGGNPDFYQSQEFCMQIGWSNNMQWNDNICTAKFGFICEFKQQKCDFADDNTHYKNQNIIINNYQKV